MSHWLTHVSACAYAWNLDLSGRWAQPCQLLVGWLGECLFQEESDGCLGLRAAWKRWIWGLDLGAESGVRFCYLV